MKVVGHGIPVFQADECPLGSHERAEQTIAIVRSPECTESVFVHKLIHLYVVILDCCNDIILEPANLVLSSEDVEFDKVQIGAGR